MKKSIFKASFEESLNLEDDGFLQFLLKEQNDKLNKMPKKGYSSFKFRFISLILTLLFPFGVNFFFLVASMSMHDSPQDLTLPISSHALLTVDVYLICLLVWFFLVLLGKLIKVVFLFPYRYHFHTLTCLVWLSLELNLLAIDISLPTLSVWTIIGIFSLVVVLFYLMIRSELKRLRKLMFSTDSAPTLTDKIAKIVTTYGMGILGVGIIIKFILSLFSIRVSTMMEGFGLFLTWIIINIGLVALLVYMELPYFLQAYYKWKYPEEYRDWEGKSLEDWYGKKYLKKHQELQDKENL